MLTPDGIVFDLLNIVPYVRKYKKVSGTVVGLYSVCIARNLVFDPFLVSPRTR